MNSARRRQRSRRTGAVVGTALVLLALGSCPPELPARHCRTDGDCPTCSSCDVEQAVCWLSNQCPGGQCRDQVCCTGCWQGDRCVEGTALDACGAGGGDCASCDANGACEAGVCRPPSAQGLALSGGTTCALRHDGTVWCYGNGLGNGMSYGSSAQPRQVVRADTDAALTGVVSLDGATATYSDGSRFCGQDISAALWCWSTSTLRATAVVDAGGAAVRDFGQFAVGPDHACALRPGNEVWCWGSNGTGRLGLGDGAPDRSDVPVPMLGPDGSQLRDATYVATGAAFTCVIRSDQTVWCVGHGTYCQLGNGVCENRTLPVEVMTSSSSALTGAVEVDGGSNTACARTQDGKIYCWGRGSEGQFGNGGIDNSPYALPVSDLQGAADLAFGSDHGCAVLADGNAWCWGMNGSGQVGDGTNLQRHRPARALLDPGRGLPIAIVLGNAHSGVLLESGQIWGWGDNSNGQLGVPPTLQPVVLAPQALPALPSTTCTPPPAAALAVGDPFACAIESAGEQRLWCWGGNEYSQLGTGLDGYLAWTSQPVVTGEAGPPAAGFVDVASGVDAQHACAIAASHSAWCWGRNYESQLGDGASYGSSRFPVQVLLDATTPLLQVESIAAGAQHTCAALADGTARCWGDNDSLQIGIGYATNTEARPQLVQVDGSTPLSGVIALAAGADHSCALLETGQVRCWGDSDYGEIGHGTADSALFAVPVVDAANQPLDQVIQLAAGVDFTCAVRQDGSLWCWGANGTGQLGDGTSVNRLHAVPVASAIGAVRQVSCGGVHACAIAQAGGLWCWGGNTYGQIGNGTVVNQIAPAQVIDDANAPLTDVVQVRAGAGFTCAANSAGVLWCWGTNTSGQLGRPIDPPLFNRARTVALGCP